MGQPDSQADDEVEAVSIYPLQAGIEIAEIAEFLGEEFNGMKRFGLQDDRKKRLSDLFVRMKKYPEVFEPFLEAYLKNDNMAREYSDRLSEIFKFE